MRAKTAISERRACELMDLSRTVLHYEGRIEADAGQLRIRIGELATQRRRFGYRRIHALLRREGERVNVKRVHRLYCEQKLQVQRRRQPRGGRGAPPAGHSDGTEPGLVDGFRQ
jgi:putative transposase